MPSNPKDFLIQQVRHKAYGEHDKGSGDYSYEKTEKIEEQIYIPTQREEWDTVLEQLNKIEEEYELDLAEEIDYVEQLKNPDKLDGVENQEIDEDASTREKHLLRQQIEENSNDEIIGTTDEAIGTNHLFDLHESIYRSTGKKAFVISKQRKWAGRISIELSDTKKKFMLMSVHEDKDGNKQFRHFGQGNPGKGLNVVDKFGENFFQYKFKADNQEYLVLSRERLDTGRCDLYGTHVSVSDYKTIGENRKLPVDQDIIFAHRVEPAIEPFTDDQLDEWREGKTHDDLAELLVGGWRQPEWFEKFALSNALVNEENGFPSHVIWVGPPGSGKSKTVTSLLRSMGESEATPFSGSGSTVKGLVPSFKESPPEEGYLLKTNRFAGVDEKMDLLSNTVQQNNERVSDVFRPLLNLLTHDTRKFESGNGSIKGEMSSTMWAVGNTGPYSITDMQDLGEKIDDAYLSRCIVYKQTDSHYEWIQDRKAEVKQMLQDQGMQEDDLYPKRNDDFISVLDTMREKKYATVDYREVKKIRKELAELVPGYMRSPYKSRYEHHMTNIVSGLAKYYYLIGKRDEVEVRSEDYEEMKSMFETIISSWGDVDLTELSDSAKKRALTPAQRRVYNRIEDEPGVEGYELAEIDDVDSLSWVLTELRRNNLVAVVEDEESTKKYYPEWADEFEEAQELEE